MAYNETLIETQGEFEMTIKTPVAVIKARIADRKIARYETMIAASQAHLAETKLVPGYTKIYA